LGGRAAPPNPRRYLVAAPLGFLAGIAVAALSSGGNTAWHTLKTVPPDILPVLLLLSATNYAARAARWLLFTAALGLDVPPARNALYYVAGFAMTTTPGKLGEALRLWLMHRAHATPYDRSAALLIADRLSDAVAVAAVVAITVGWFAHYVWMAAVAILVVGAITAIALRPALLLLLTDTAYRRLRRWPRAFVGIRRAIRALHTLGSPRVFGAALLLGTLGWCAEAASFSLLLQALHASINQLAAAFIFAFGVMVGAVSIIPGGLGSTEATMLGLLATQGVAFPVALVATAIIRLTTLWFAVALGLLALPIAVGWAPARHQRPAQTPHDA
jgi:uncharacterized protein (TIRG00374 family)